MYRIQISADPSKLEIDRAAPLRFRWRLPGEENESAADVELVSSIRKQGIIDPPILYGEQPIAVCGHRRVAAARAAGIEKIDAFLIDESAATKDNITSLWLEDVRYGAELSDLEEIILAAKCRTFLGDAFAASREELETAVGRSLSAEYLEATGRLLDLPKDILDSLHEGRLSTGNILSLGNHDTERASRILAMSGLGRKDKSEAVRMMMRIQDIGPPAWESFIEEYEKKGGALLEVLRAITCPSLADDLSRIGDIVKAMGLPQGSAIHPPENLEGGSYRLNARIRNEQTYEILLQKLKAALEDGKIERLLDIIKGRVRHEGKDR